MRRSSFTLLLSFLLVLVQHGALLHELGHLRAGGQDAEPALRADAAPASGAVCLSCEAFAQVANPANATPGGVPLAPAPLLRSPDPSYGAATADSPAPRSRGPPVI